MNYVYHPILPPAVTLEMLKARLQDEPLKSRRRLRRALMRWLRRFENGVALLDPDHFDNALLMFKASPDIEAMSRGARNNLASSLRALARLYLDVRENPIEIDQCIAKSMIFDLSVPRVEPWGVQNRRLAVAAYYLKTLPPRVESLLRPFFDWKDADRSEGLISVESLDGTVTELVSSSAWTRKSGADPWQPTRSETWFTSTIRAGLGFARLSSDAPDPKLRGLGIPEGELRLTHLLIGENMAAYLRFLVTRRGFSTGNVENAVRHYLALMKGQNAYIRFAQKALLPDLQAVLGNQTPQSSAAWHDWCDAQVRAVERTVKLIRRTRITKSRHRQGRSAYNRLTTLLAYARPLDEVVWPTVLALSDGRPGPSASPYTQFVYERRVFTLAGLTAAPLRAENWGEMEWGKNLFLHKNRWHIFMPAEKFKNRRALHQDYNVQIDDYAQDSFTVYYRKWKQYFGYDPLSPEHAEKCSIVMADCGRPGVAVKGTTIAQRLHFLGAVWNLRISPHALRHIRVTDWLKRHPDDFDTAAGLLHETVAVVRKAYAHLASADHARRSNQAHAGLEERARQHLRQARRKRRAEGREDPPSRPPKN